VAKVNHDRDEGERTGGGSLVAEEREVKPDELRKLAKRREEKQEAAAKALAKV